MYLFSKTSLNVLLFVMTFKLGDVDYLTMIFIFKCFQCAKTDCTAENSVVKMIKRPRSQIRKYTG